jgi:predicted oxidoreductase
MLELSPVIAGCMKWGQWGVKYSTAQYLQLIEDCIVNKITSFDHADIYGDYTVEEEFGEALKLKPHLATTNAIDHKVRHKKIYT